MSGKPPLEGSAFISQGLQYIQLAPTQFNQLQANQPDKSIVEISSTPQQTLKSFGASGAWWPNFLRDFPTAQQQNLSELLFSEDWLHLSSYRNNMGASGDNDSVKVSTLGRGVESFMNTNGSYDWTRDSAGMYYLRAAQEAGVSSIAFFVNAIPAALTAAKTPSGTDLGVDSIAPSAHRLHPPMNEPDNNFADAGQEGMSVATTARASVFQLLRTVLQSSSSSPAVTSIKILGDETSQITSQALLVINTSLPNAPPPIKMTEISTFKSALGIYRPFGWTDPKIFGPEYDPSIDSALDMARYVWQWLTLVNPESWDWWTAVSNMLPCSPSVTPGCEAQYNKDAGFNYGLIYIDNNYSNTKDYNFYLPKRFWVFRHFTKFYRPGAVRYDIPNEILPYGTVAVAALGVDKAWSATFINRNETEQVIKMKVPKVDLKILAAVQTTQIEDWKSVALPVVGQDRIFRATLPAKGVLTLQFATDDPASLAGRRQKIKWQERKEGFRNHPDRIRHLGL
ncbi:MAG: hypothetical protein Q9171_000238 [Xanthocarpia ochracea]